MTPERLRRLAASPWLDAAIVVAVTVATWFEVWGEVGRGDTGAAMTIGVVIADDQQLVRAGFPRA